MVVKAASRTPCGHPRRRRCGARTLPGTASGRRGTAQAVGTLRAMSPEEAGGDGAPEPDDAPSGPPPNPLDRPWVHPSELRSFVSTPAAPPRETRPREWAIGVGSAVAAVLATVLVLVAFGALGGRHRSPLPPPVVTNPGDVVDYAVAERVGTAVAPSVVTVRVGRRDATKPVGSGVVLTSDRVDHRRAQPQRRHRRGRRRPTPATSSPAKVVGTDPQTDLALLAVADGDLQLARLGGRARRGSARPSSRSSAGHPLPGRHQRGVRPRRHGRRRHRHRRRRPARDRHPGHPRHVGRRAGRSRRQPRRHPHPGGRPAAPTGSRSRWRRCATSRDQLDGSGKVTHGWIGVLCDRTRPRAEPRAARDRRP